MKNNNKSILKVQFTFCVKVLHLLVHTVACGVWCPASFRSHCSMQSLVSLMFQFSLQHIVSGVLYVLVQSVAYSLWCPLFQFSLQNIRESRCASLGQDNTKVLKLLGHHHFISSTFNHRIFKTLSTSPEFFLTFIHSPAASISINQIK